MNWKNRGVNGVEKKKTALRVFSRKKSGVNDTLNWKNRGVNGVEKKKTALRVFSRKKSGVNGVELEK